MEHSKEKIQLTPTEKRVRKALIKFAAAKRTVAYQALSNIADLGLEMQYDIHVEMMSTMLSNVSCFELQEGRPLLSAVVINSNKEHQGNGFFKLCTEKENELKELLNCESLSPSIKQKLEFSAARIKDCFDFWSDKERLDLNRDKEIHLDN
ncbi:hypothetical protein CLV62_12553 [Dysgonomonas alginatilytica]|uniref:Uncharacterized protein n=1 Tax=Dysgonomonas alginatilytica TaxID=1605892 RepID=A0A2V3PMU9_9BACT|nr:hypothetical protein [Dysgonomonas alginatilytica]PXV61220.1 hypothetical protein CLV62_12553 [Dysgonomonas alginatilytica]